MITVEAMNRLLDERRGMGRHRLYATTLAAFAVYASVIAVTVMLVRKGAESAPAFSDLVEIDLVTPYAPSPTEVPEEPPSPAATTSSDDQTAADEPAPPEPVEPEPEPPSRPAEAAVVAEPEPSATPAPRRTRPPRPPAKSTPAPKPAASGPGAGVPAVPGVPVGSVEGLDIHQPGYGWYKLAIIRKVSQNWLAPVDMTLREGTTVTLHFYIQRDGTIEGLRTVSPSGNSLFDRAATRAILKSSPLPPLPPELGRDRLGVRYRFEYRK